MSQLCDRFVSLWQRHALVEIQNVPLKVFDHLDKTVFLSALSDKQQIYYLSYYLARFEQMAQRNIRRHLALLTA